MLKFKINEIPDGYSEETVELEAETLNMEPYQLKSGSVTVEFDKQNHLIRATLHVDAVIPLQCDRSLEEFDFEANARYEVLFDEYCEDLKVEEDITRKPLDIPANKIDLATEVRDSLLLEIPIKKLHPRYLNEDGTATDFEFEYAETAEEEGDEDDIDPRWAELKKLKNQ